MQIHILATGLVAAVVMAVAHLGFEAGPGWVFWIVLALILFLYGFTYVWVHLGIGYIPEIEGDALDLEVLAQHGNDLILRDNTTHESFR
jgi:hypothetical protein